MIARDIDDIKYQLDDQDLNSSMTLRAEKACPNCAQSFKDQFNWVANQMLTLKFLALAAT